MMTGMVLRGYVKQHQNPFFWGKVAARDLALHLFCNDHLFQSITLLMHRVYYCHFFSSPPFSLSCLFQVCYNGCTSAWIQWATAHRSIRDASIHKWCCIFLFGTDSTYARTANGKIEKMATKSK